MKSYNEFKSEVVPHITNLCSERGMYPDVLLMKNGIRPRNPEEKRIIDETNFRYGHPGANCLVGDYLLIIDVPEGKTGYQFRFPIDALYSRYCTGSWEMVDKAVINELQKVETLDHSILRNLTDYSMVKDKLLLCMRNADRFNAKGSGFVFRRIGDMDMVLYVVLNDNKPENRLITPVSKSIAESWGLTEDEVFAVALDNTARISPPRAFYFIDDIIGINKNGCDLMSVLTPPRKVPMNPFSLTVSAIPSSDGASAMFYPGVFERLSEMAEGDFFAVFTGKDECHVHRVDGISCDTLKSQLVRMNREYPETVLTQYVYRYDSVKKELKVVL